MFLTIKTNLIAIYNLSKHIWFIVKFKDVPISEAHFNFWSTPNHVNRRAIEATLREMGGQPKAIIETGTAAWGTNSTRLWDAYIRKYGGSLISIDIRPDASTRLAGQLSRLSKCVVSDSVEFLRNNRGLHADIYFLDSWDIDWANPHPSAVHGLAEFEALPNNLQPGTLILIDDTPSSLDYIPNGYNQTAEDYFKHHHVLPGKGAMVLKQILKTEEYQLLFHEYALLLRKK